MRFLKIQHFLFAMLSCFASNLIMAQNVGINQGGAAPNLSAILDLDGVTGFTGPNGYKGLLIPRMTLAQRTGIVTLPAAAQGLLVYQTDGTQGFYYNTSLTTTPAWTYLSTTGTDWSVTGNSSTNPSLSALGAAIGAGQNYVGTSDTKDFVIGTSNLERMRVLSTGNVGILNKVPGSLFTVGANLFAVNSTGNVGIGTAPSTPIIHINGTYTSTFGSGFGSWGISYSATSNNTSSSTHWGASFSGIANAGSNVNNLVGLQGEASVNDVTGATMNSATGVYGVVDNAAVITAQAINEAYGIEGAVSVWDKLNATHTAGVASNLNFSGSSVNTNAYLFRGINASTDISAGTITNLYGINIPALSKSGTAVVTNAWGSYVGMPTAGTNNYGAYFGGTVGIGVTTPAQALDIYSKFQVDNNGNLIKINNVTYTWPATNAAGVLTNSGAGVLTWAAAGASSGWALTGNAGTDGGATNFLGTTDAKALSIRVGGVGVGFKSGLIDPANSGSTFFGYKAGKNILAGDAISSTGFGYQALTNLSAATSGTHNTAIGNKALMSNTDGTANTAVGSLSLFSNVLGIQNTAVGVNALNGTVGDGVSTGQNNTAVGYQTLYFNTTGSTNTAIGYLSLNTNNTGSDLTALGAGTDVGSAGLTNATAIGANAIVSSSNAVVLGNAASVLIGRSTTVNNAKLSIKDGHIQTSQTTAPTIAVGAAAGTAASATLLAGSNDITGRLTLTEGSAAWAAGVQCTVTFNKTYVTAPLVILTAANANGADGARFYFATSTTTGFSINFGTAAVATGVYSWNYLVIEP